MLSDCCAGVDYRLTVECREMHTNRITLAGWCERRTLNRCWTQQDESRAVASFSFMSSSSQSETQEVCIWVTTAGCMRTKFFQMKLILEQILWIRGEVALSRSSERVLGIV
ncbi:hypothetical protein GOODEAATRI_027149, partial [Goodea atripinnis]